MTGTEIATLVRQQTEQSTTTYNDSTILGYINRALDDLTPVAKMLMSKSGITLTITGGNASISISGDADLVTAHEFVDVYFTPSGGVEEWLRRLRYSDLTSRGWKRDTTAIKLQNLGAASGTARVDYYKRLANLTAIENTPELPQEYHFLLVLFCCARIQEREGSFAFKRDFTQEYLVGKQNFAAHQIWEMEPHMRPLIQQARVIGLLGTSSKR